MSTPDPEPEGRTTAMSASVAVRGHWLELAVALGLLALSVYYVADALALPQSSNSSDVGPGAFPMLIGAGTLFALLLLLVRIGVELWTGSHGAEVVVTRAGWLALSVLVLVGTAAFFERLGIVAVTFGCAALLMLLAGERRLPVVLLTSAGLAAGIYVVFAILLGIRFP